MIHILLKICIFFVTIIIIYEINKRFFRVNSASSPENLKIINVLDEISQDLVRKIKNDKDYRDIINKRTVNTIFTEMTHDDYDILATNKNKGEEISIRLKDKYGNYFSAEEIINSLIHELSHSATFKIGHFKRWEDIYNHLYNKFKDKYVKILTKKTGLI